MQALQRAQAENRLPEPIRRSSEKQVPEAPAPSPPSARELAERWLVTPRRPRRVCVSCAPEQEENEQVSSAGWAN